MSKQENMEELCNAKTKEIKDVIYGLYQYFKPQGDMLSLDNHYKLLNQFIGIDELEFDQNKEEFVFKETQIGIEKGIKKGAYCGKAFDDGEAVYSCRDCATDPTCVLCEDCYNGTNHEGHEVHIHIHSYGFGCCDCGDEEAFKDLECIHHKKEFKKSVEEISSAIPDEMKISIDCLIEVILDFVINVIKLAPKSIEESIDLSEITRTLDSYYDFFNLDQENKDYEVYELIIWNDEVHTYNQVIKVFTSILGYTKERAKVFTRNIDIIGRESVMESSDYDKVYEKAKEILVTELGVSIKPRTCLAFEETAALLIGYISLITNPKLKNLKNGLFMDYFLQVLSERLLFKYDKLDTHCNLNFKFNNITSSQNDSKCPCNVPKVDSYSLDLDMRRFNDVDLDFRPFDNCSGSISSRYQISILPKKEWYFPQTKLYQLFELDYKFWKVIQNQLKEIYTRSVFSTTSNFRILAALNYAALYPNYVKYIEKYPELTSSLSSFSVQIFTVPSIAKILNDELGFIRCLVNLLDSFFTGTDSVVENYAFLEGPTASSFIPIKDWTRVNEFRWLIHDFEYFIDHEQVLSSISNDHVLLAQILHFLTRFQGLHPIKRMSRYHVEYEDNRESISIELISKLDGFIEKYPKAFKFSLPNLIKAIRHTMLKIYLWICEGGDSINKKFDLLRNDQIEFEDVDDGFGNFYTIVRFNQGGNESVSFYYTLNLFLGNLLYNIRNIDTEDMYALGYTDLVQILIGPDFVKSNDPQIEKKKMLTVFDYPIRALALAFQTAANYWVRNGPLYRYIGDFITTPKLIFIKPILLSIQFMFVLFPPGVVLQTLLERFELSYWFKNRTGITEYDQSQQTHMLTNLFRLLIHCLQERGDFTNRDHKQKLSEFIIQNTYKPISFTALNQSKPEEFNKELEFTDLLKELCDYKPPEISDNFGEYCLKKEYMHLLNPYSFFYNQNKKDETEKLKKENITDIKPYFIPIIDQVLIGPFKLIGDFIHNKLFCKILFFSLYNCLKDPTKNYSLLDYLLHILFIASQDLNTSYIVKGKDKSETLVGSIWDLCYSLFFDVSNINSPEINIQMNCISVIMELIKSSAYSDKKEKLMYLLDLFDKYSGSLAQEEIAYFKGAFLQKEIKKDSDEHKRKLDAKARMERMRKQFSNAQKNFVETQKDLYDEIDSFDGELMDKPNDQADIPLWKKPYITGNCIVCQEKGSLEEPCGIIGFIQPSNSLSLLSFEQLDLGEDVEDKSDNFIPKSNSTSDVPRLYPFDPSLQSRQAFPGSKHTLNGDHITSCGHILHISCVRNTLLDNVNSTSKFICPLCKSLNNIILPIYENPGLGHNLKQEYTIERKDWIRNFLLDTEHFKENKKNLPEDAIKGANEYFKGGKFSLNSLTDDEINRPNRDGNVPHNNSSLVDSNNVSDSDSIVYDNEDNTIILPGSLPRGNHIDILESDSQIRLQSIEFANDSNIDEKIISSIRNILITFVDKFNLKKRDQSIPYGTPKCPIDLLIYSFAYTINFVEISDRSNITKNSALTPFILDRISTINRDSLTLLWNNIITFHKSLGPKSFSANKDLVNARLLTIEGLLEKSVLEDDPFLLLVEFSLQYLPEAKIDISDFIRFLALVQVTRVMLGCIDRANHTEKCTNNNDYEEIPGYFIKPLEKLAIQVLEISIENLTKIWNEGGLKYTYKLIYSSLVTFLRKCVIFVNSCQIPINRPTHFTNELEYLLTTLCLPTMEEILESFEDQDFMQLINLWYKPIKTSKDTIMIEYPYEYQLLKLPPRIDLLYNICDELMIKTCRPTQYGHAICLLCGQILCKVDVCCNQDKIPWYTRHREQCSNLIGLYLLPKSSKILVVYSDRITEIQAPYLTLHGETHKYPSGLPLFFEENRYCRLKLTYLTHNIPNLIARASEREIPLF